MSEYLLINAGIISVPLLLTFESKIKFYKKLPALFFSILIVGSVYIIWDIFATGSGDWTFNPRYLSGFYLYNLPVEEVLFFITVPYACIFIYETGKFYLTDKEMNLNKDLLLIPAVLFLLTAIFFMDQNYTFTVMLFNFLFFVLSYLVFHDILSTKLYWYFAAFNFIPFLIINYLLTSLPIVTYGSSAIWNIRITTIPLEDFFYSFSMLSFYLAVYIKAKKFLVIK